MHEDKQAKYTENDENRENTENRENVGGNEWDNDLDLEVVDLDTLDTTNESEEIPRDNKKPSWSVSVLHWQRSFNRRRWRPVFVAVSLLLVCLLLSLNVQGIAFLTKKARTDIASHFVLVPAKLTEHLPTPISVDPSLVLSSSQLGFSCVLGNAWSPDSTSIAILGYSNGCENSSAHAIGLATILDAHSGRQLASFSPDAPIRKAFATQYPTLHDVLYIYYDSPSWSPDKRHLALTFTISAQAENSGSQYIGALMYDSHLKSFRVFMHRNAGTLSSQGNMASYVEWDVVHGNVMPPLMYKNDDPLIIEFTIPTAEGYTWGKNGELVPQRSETVSTSGVGNTSGDPSFSIWQPGEISLLKQDAYGFTYTPGIFLWDINFVAWSPDGRYFVQNVLTAARLELPGAPKPSQKVLTIFHLENVPILPIRDKALLSVLKSMSNKNTQPSDPANYIFVEWTPDGKLMLITSYETPTMMTLYASRSGFPVVTLKQQSKYKADAQSSHEGYFTWSSPCWSPDGQYLLMQDSNTNAIAIWDIPHLL